MKSIVFTQRVWDLPYIPHATTCEYIDLKTQPERIDEIQELKDDPGLKPLVLALNAADGLFMTHGCAVASRSPGIEGITIIPVPTESDNARCWYTSYVAFSFWYFEGNRREHYETMYQRFPDSENGNVCFEIQPVYFLTAKEQQDGMKWSESNGTGCVLWVSAWGNVPREAHDNWTSVIRHVINFFAKLQRSGDRSGITVSQHMRHI